MSKTCLHRQEPLDEIVTPQLHQECQFRIVMGSLAHLQGRCGCFVAGSEEGDPSGMSVRQAARAAYDYWRSLTFPEREASVTRRTVRREEVDHAYQA